MHRTSIPSPHCVSPGQGTEYLRFNREGQPNRHVCLCIINNWSIGRPVHNSKSEIKGARAKGTIQTASWDSVGEGRQNGQALAAAAAESHGRLVPTS